MALEPCRHSLANIFPSGAVYAIEFEDGSDAQAPDSLLRDVRSRVEREMSVCGAGGIPHPTLVRRSRPSLFERGIIRASVLHPFSEVAKVRLRAAIGLTQHDVTVGVMKGYMKV